MSRLRLAHYVLLLGGGSTEYLYNASLSTFSPAIAKRTGKKAFKASVIVQDKWNYSNSKPDQIFLSTNPAIGGNFFRFKDLNQGTVVVTYTPDWNGNDGKTHYVMDLGAIDIFKYTSGNLDARLHLSNDTNIFALVDVSDWVAGTTYLITVRWDLTNPIVDDKHCILSVNDTHYQAETGQVGSIVLFPDSSGYAVSMDGGGNEEAGNALIEGLVIYRRVLYDGANGINLGYGDEINLIYNGGTHKDPCAITGGSWDVVFALPTNCQIGAMTTTLDAWSHPHSSNLITAADGFMLRATAWQNWSDEGSPTDPALLDATEKIYPGGYKFATDDVNEGKYYDVTVTPGAKWVIRGITHCSGGTVAVILHDQTNNVEIGRVTGTSTSRTAPNVHLFTGTAPTGCTTLRVKIINTDASQTVYAHQVELYTNLVTNPSLEGTYAGTPPIPPSWSNYNGLDAGDSEAETTTVHSGLESLQLNTGANSEGINIAVPTTQYGYYCAGLWAYGDGTKTVSFKSSGVTEAHFHTSDADLSANYNYINFPVAAAWAHRAMIYRVVHASQMVLYIFGQTGAAGERFIDDVYVIAMDRLTFDTISPSDLSESTESYGLRVDGRDTLTQPTNSPNLAATSGHLTVNVTPRHAIADCAKFGQTSEYILDLTQNANNYIRVYRTANTVTLAVNINGAGAQTATWNATGAWAAMAVKKIEVIYGSSGVSLKVDGTEQASIAGAVAFAAQFTQPIYWGSDSSGANQLDGWLA